MRKNTIIYVISAIAVVASTLYFISGNYNSSIQSKDKVISCNENDSACLSQSVADYSKKYGIGESLLALSKYMEIHPNDTTSCHVAAHKLGGEAWQKFHNIKDIYTMGSGLCSFGFLHGSITQAFVDLSKEQVYGQVADFCSALRDLNFAAADECDHGIGHASIIRFKNFEEGVMVCEALSSERSVHSCLQGAVMEYTSSFPADPILAADLSSELYSNCLKLSSDSYIGACIFASSTPSIRTDGTQGNSKLAWERCLKLTAKFYQKCAEGIGVGAPAVTNWSASKSSQICTLLPDEYAVNCIQAAVKIFGTVFLDIEKAKLFCNTLPTKYTKYCVSEYPDLEKDIEKYKLARK